MNKVTMKRAPSGTSLGIHPHLQPNMFSVRSKKYLFLCLERLWGPCYWKEGMLTY